MAIWLSVVLSGWLAIAPGQPQSEPRAQPEVPAQATPQSTPEAERAVAQAETILTAEDRREVLDGIERTLARRAFVVGVDFGPWKERLAEAQARVDQADEPVELAAAVNRVLAGFRISHLRLKPPSRTAEPRQEGAREEASENAQAEWTDRSEWIDGFDQPEAPGSPTSPNSPVDRRRAVPENQTLEWRGDVAVLRIRSFDDERYSREKVEAIVDEIAPRAKGIVVDLRSNGGGAVTQMGHFLSMFLAEGVEVGVYVGRDVARGYEREKGSPPETAEAAAAWTTRKYRVRKNTKPPLTAPVAVVLSRGSASASEIVAAALRDHRNAAIVGQASAGKVLLSIHVKLPHGFELQIPTADYVTSRGVRLEGNPIRPHITAPVGRGGGGSGRGGGMPAIETAVELITHGL